MTLDPEGEVLVCQPAGGISIVGSITKECQMCERAVYIAPSGQQLLQERPEMMIACTICGFTMMMEEQHEIAPLQERQFWELVENGLSRDEVVEIADRLGVPVEDHLDR